MSPRFVLCPYRFSADVPAMGRFLETVGLHKIVSTPDDGFGIFAGRSGRVAVHGIDETATGAGSGETQLSFETPDASTAEGHLSAVGLDAVVWDEAYGRHAGVRHPGGGGGIWINEEMTDFHGYRTHPRQESSVDVVAVHFSDDFAADREFFAAFGYVPHGPRESGWQELVAERPRGVIGLHAPTGDEGTVGADAGDSPVGRPAWAGLAFRVEEDLTGCAERLRAAGWTDARVEVDPGPTKLVVTDPDGCRIEIHRAGR